MLCNVCFVFPCKTFAYFQPFLPCGFIARAKLSSVLIHFFLAEDLEINFSLLSQEWIQIAKSNWNGRRVTLFANRSCRRESSTWVDREKFCPTQFLVLICGFENTRTVANIWNSTVYCYTSACGCREKSILRRFAFNSHPSFFGFEINSYRRTTRSGVLARRSLRITSIKRLLVATQNTLSTDKNLRLPIL